MKITVEMSGEDVTDRLLAGETVYFVPGEDQEPEPNGEWPEGWQIMGMIVWD
jgi:hypothetical protein